jgi:hypothetical protein
MTNKRGVLVFARNNSQVDYIKQARFLAQRARKYLNLPTTLVTDSPDFLEHEYPDYNKVFDRVISMVWKSKDVKNNTVLSLGENHSQRRFYDGALVAKQLDWKNNSRSLAYDVSPYEETLLLDSDVVISNSNWLECFSQTNDFLTYKQCTELLDIDRGDDFQRISDTSVDFYWATAIFFRKTQENKTFFDLVKHIQENWQHYCRIFQINSPYFRNDYAFSIAIHIMNGYQTGNFAQPMPGTLYFVTDKSILWEISDNSQLILLEKPTYDGEYTPLRIRDVNLHCMNKFSLNRCIDET